VRGAAATHENVVVQVHCSVRESRRPRRMHARQLAPHEIRVQDPNVVQHAVLAAEAAVDHVGDFGAGDAGAGVAGAGGGAGAGQDYLLPVGGGLGEGVRVNAVGRGGGADVRSQVLEVGIPEASTPPMSNDDDAASSHTLRQLQQRLGGGKPVKVMGTRSDHWLLTKLRRWRAWGGRGEGGGREGGNTCKSTDP